MDAKTLDLALLAALALFCEGSAWAKAGFGNSHRDLPPQS
jgi:hypothetical protein